jgi:phosphate transport system protein
LDRIRVVLAELAAEARRILADATAAVVGPTSASADTSEAHASTERLRARSHELEGELVTLLTLQAPVVAGDLRLVLAGLRIAATVGRMAELADHIAGIADRRAPAAVVPAPLRPAVTRLGGLCDDIAGRLVTAISSDDPATAQRVEDADEPVDEVHRRLMAAITDPDWPHGIEAAVDLALVSRYYERFADQAVTAARHLGRIPSRPATSARSRPAGIAT